MRAGGRRFARSPAACLRKRPLRGRTARPRASIRIGPGVFLEGRAAGKNKRADAGARMHGEGQGEAKGEQKAQDRGDDNIDNLAGRHGRLSKGGDEQRSRHEGPVRGLFCAKARGQEGDGGESGGRGRKEGKNHEKREDVQAALRQRRRPVRGGRQKVRLARRQEEGKVRQV